MNEEWMLFIIFSVFHCRKKLGFINWLVHSLFFLAAVLTEIEERRIELLSVIITYTLANATAMLFITYSAAVGKDVSRD